MSATTKQDWKANCRGSGEDLTCGRRWASPELSLHETWGLLGGRPGGWKGGVEGGVCRPEYVGEGDTLVP